MTNEEYYDTNNKSDQVAIAFGKWLNQYCISIAQNTWVKIGHELKDRYSTETLYQIWLKEPAQ